MVHRVDSKNVHWRSILKLFRCAKHDQDPSCSTVPVGPVLLVAGSPQAVQTNREYRTSRCQSGGGGVISNTIRAWRCDTRPRMEPSAAARGRSRQFFSR